MGSPYLHVLLRQTVLILDYGKPFKQKPHNQKSKVA